MVLNMIIKNRGLIFDPDKHDLGKRTYAQVPCAIKLKDRFRVFFAARRAQRSSEILFVDFSLDFQQILSVQNEPILKLGGNGAFDQNGTMPDDIVKIKEKFYLYYSGWGGSKQFPHTNEIGVAISEDNCKTFTKVAKNPIVSLNKGEPYSASSGSIIINNGIFEMYYSSGVEWVKNGCSLEHNHDIKMATSKDGLNWSRNYQRLIEQRPDESHARPVPIKVGGELGLIYCTRKKVNYRDGPGSYRLNYISRKESGEWIQRPEVTLPVSGEKWDSLMQAYPYFIQDNEKGYILYNGNGFGQTGIGLLEMDIVK